MSVILFLLLGAGVSVAGYIAYVFVSEGVKDDVNFPLGNCDTSMVEEVTGE
jgi:hypothetical protein